MVTGKFNLNYYVDQLPVETAVNLNACQIDFYLNSCNLTSTSIPVKHTKLRSQFRYHFDLNSCQPNFDLNSCHQPQFDLNSCQPKYDLSSCHQSEFLQIEPIEQTMK